MQKNEIEQSDINLYKAFLLGDNSAFDRLMIKYRLDLIKFIYTYVKDVETAEDIAQNSFLYMIINKKEYDFKYSFKTYLFTIAKSRAMNYLKSKRNYVSLDAEQFEVYDVTDNIEEKLEIDTEYKNVAKAIKKLKQKYQTVIYLFYFEELKYKDISRIMNISMSKTKMLINRAKKQLKEMLEGGDK